MTRREKILLVLVFVLFVFTSFYAIFNSRGLLSLIKLKNELRKIEEENTRLKKENEELTKKIKLLEENNEYLELIIRDSLNMGKEEEVFIKFIEKKGKSE